MPSEWLNYHLHVKISKHSNITAETNVFFFFSSRETKYSLMTVSNFISKLVIRFNIITMKNGDSTNKLCSYNEHGYSKDE